MGFYVRYQFAAGAGFVLLGVLLVSMGRSSGSSVFFVIAMVNLVALEVDLIAERLKVST